MWSWLLWTALIAPTPEAAEAAAAFGHSPGQWTLVGGVGAGGHTGLAVGPQLAAAAGHVWPRRGLGVELRGRMLLSTTTLGMYAGCGETPCVSSANATMARGGLTVVARFGGTWGPNFAHVVLPVGVDLDPVLVEMSDEGEKRKTATYLTLGVGFGFLRAVGRRGLLGVDVFPRGGVLVSEQYSKDVLPRFRIGPEALFLFGLRL